MNRQLKPKFFKTPAALRSWLTKNQSKSKELWIGFYKKASSKKGVTYSEALDQALCFGWIDGIRRKIDDESYTNRFTPRRKKSNWSKINIAHVHRLTKAGLMTTAGMKAFELANT